MVMAEVQEESVEILDLVLEPLTKIPCKHSVNEIDFSESNCKVIWQEARILEGIKN